MLALVLESPHVHRNRTNKHEVRESLVWSDYIFHDIQV